MTTADAVGHVVLVGLMGSGKTTVGRMLADRLGRRFLDTDEVVESTTGRSVREIFVTDGEPAFRVLESRALREVLGADEPVVVAAAGGAVLSAENRDAMRAAGTVVWLRAAPELLVARVAGEGHRPLLDDDASGALSQMAADRDPLYREVAAVTIDVEGRAPEAVVQAIVEMT